VSVSSLVFFSVDQIFATHNCLKSLLFCAIRFCFNQGPRVCWPTGSPSDRLGARRRTRYQQQQRRRRRHQARNAMLQLQMTRSTQQCDSLQPLQQIMKDEEGHEASKHNTWRYSFQRQVSCAVYIIYTSRRHDDACQSLSTNEDVHSVKKYSIQGDREWYLPKASKSIASFFNLLTTKSWSFYALSRRPLLSICNLIGLFVFKILCS